MPTSRPIKPGAEIAGRWSMFRGTTPQHTYNSMAIAQNREELSPAERSGARVCNTRRDDDAILVGRHDLAAAGELQRQPQLRQRSQRRISRADRAGPFIQTESMGLCQVHGNVSEWTQDCYHSDYLGAPSDGSAWISGDCSRHMVRGGSWGYEPSTLRAAYRYAEFTGARVIFEGFRVARTLVR